MQRLESHGLAVGERWRAELSEPFLDARWE